MKKAALVDIGNVILHVNFEDSLRTLIPPELADPVGRINSLLEKKDEFESGAMGDEEFIAWASKKLRFEGPKEDFLAAWNDIFTPNLPMWETLRELKARGFQLILFSNTNRMHADYFLSHFAEVFDLFEGRIFSYEVGCAKPDPAMYHKAMAAYDLEPENTLYFDDLPENITTGLQMGFLSWRYNADCHEALTRWLVETLD
ncbi:HAD family hydrolase [Roseibacillus ishigakijimensis]|uniref:HAD family phosphatase n=1 Tax=Roseibacillus ishigakijimensis TaxID=454146 RepID=A0A934RP98_9BACT|nr:HAD family phosphatase [Roseibacillus ishigakijimensis]MBK1832978.1 HAD family phosphatase [Roseibacillus ishigakijimensis]